MHEGCIGDQIGAAAFLAGMLAPIECSGRAQHHDVVHAQHMHAGDGWQLRKHTCAGLLSLLFDCEAVPVRRFLIAPATQN